ncbi:transcriptional regulator [Sphaerochaeta pleomorpha str. Grapes]|uniref:Transcriptional regulator n=1 Tax=Sphaerochaeta pleomorpha (strain ATCC BAA-1885 / DSM 22778 / Grapes) TaxID=158190 RepID=G8QTE2_SPHPG|nr:MurR/RpiR family transcriptional regulator [Sphaerochaeta pleomorpha]AEV30183.1 transcriptional regulator [Sphaerochaeta pleomorpha str. Grapes]
MGLVSRLENVFPSLSPIEKRITSYFMSHEAELVGKPILDIAQACDTSKSAVVRLCKRIGYNGYKELQTDLSAERALRQRDKVYERSDIYPQSSTASICTLITHNSIRVLESTLQNLDLSSMDKAVDALCSARRVDLYGVGNSGIVAEDANIKLRRLDFFTTCCTDIHMALVSSSTLNADDVAVFFSHSGTTSDILHILEVVKAQGALTVAVTCRGGNTLSKNADIVLETASSENLSRSGAMASRIAMLEIVDMLFSIIASRNYKDVKDILDHTADLFQKEHV